MDGRAAQAIFGNGPGFRVFGRRLGRLTLRHCAALLAVGNPAAVGAPSAGISFGEAWQAVALCAARDDDELRAAMWPRKSWWAGWSAGRKWGRRWADEWAVFESWMIAEVGGLPRFLPGAKRGKMPAGDWVIAMAARLMARGMQPAAAWWTPLCLAAHLNAAFAEADGRDVPLMGETLADELRAMGWSEEDLGG